MKLIHSACTALLTFGSVLLSPSAQSADLPKASPITKPTDLDTRRTFPPITDRADWKLQREEIRERVQVSCGLHPLPEKTPLNSSVSGKVERDGYSIEKVYFESYPGFFVAGNLYRPLGRGNGPFPAILNPHGHWNRGRFEDSDAGSIAARCISFARFGMIAFSYDMAGYNDTRQVTHRFGADPTNQLWNISLMGLQTWNSIRALDFLESLPDVDKSKLACTGESGGGTQTFILGAIDSRLALQAPIVMVSHSMQGGCLCENAPGLRVDVSNMEISAVPAPRPQVLVGASGDWTRATLTVEGPSIQKVYELFNARDQLHYNVFNFGHNYNKTSREEVYRFIGKHLLNVSRPESLVEKPYSKEADAELVVFNDQLPSKALKESELVALIIAGHQKAYQAAVPTTKGGLEKLESTVRPLWRQSMQLKTSTETNVVLERTGDRSLNLRRGAEILGTVDFPLGKRKSRGLIILADSASQAEANALKTEALRNSISVILLIPPPLPSTSLFTNYYSTYNRTPSQIAVRNVGQVVKALRKEFPEIAVAGLGRAGSWAMLAAPLASAVIADTQQMDPSEQKLLMSTEVFAPGLLQHAAFEGPLLLAAGKPLALGNLSSQFSTQRIETAHALKGRKKSVTLKPTPFTPVEIVKWVKNY